MAVPNVWNVDKNSCFFILFNLIYSFKTSCMCPCCISSCVSGGGETDPRSGHGGQQEYVCPVWTQRHHRESHREPHCGGRRARQVWKVSPTMFDSEANVFVFWPMLTQSLCGLQAFSKPRRRQHWMEVLLQTLLLLRHGQRSQRQRGVCFYVRAGQTRGSLSGDGTRRLL